MPALQVRDLPQDVYEGLKDCARNEHRSLAQQTIRAVEEMLARRESAEGDEGPLVVALDSLQARQDRIARRKALFARIEQHASELPENLPSVQELTRASRDELDRRDEEAILQLGGPER